MRQIVAVAGFSLFGFGMGGEWIEMYFLRMMSEFGW